MSSDTHRPIALALSGGGIRAMIFHLGVLKFLAERELLESVGRISTVSGGSLLVGLIFKENGMSWPTSEFFLSAIYPVLRKKLCDRSLQWGAVRQLLNPKNFRYIFSRSNLLGLALQKEWKISQKLSELPLVPEWSINGTTAENGKRFRFKRNDFGDYDIGYAPCKDFLLAYALAVSAAFPGGFGPLKINATEFDWKKRPWGAPIGSESPVDIGYKALHLYDGGVYDNLGLEPFFDAGKGVEKIQDCFILVSDAGSPLPRGFAFRWFNPLRLKRIADIMSDQAHALRVRTFANYLQRGKNRGAFFYINTPITDSASDESMIFASNFPTTLRRLTLEEFDRLSDHGCQVATKFENQYGFYRVDN